MPGRRAEAAGVGRRRRPTRAVQRGLPSRGRVPDEPERIAADAAAVGHDDGQDRVRRDRRVDRVAAGAQDREPGRGREVMGRDDRAVAAAGERRRDQRPRGVGESSIAPSLAVRRREGRCASLREGAPVTAAATLWGPMHRSLGFVLLGTFTLRFSTGLTGGLLSYYLARLHEHGGPEVHADGRSACIGVALLRRPSSSCRRRSACCPTGSATTGSCSSGRSSGAWPSSSRGPRRTCSLLGGTRLLEGASTAASVPSILGFIAAVTAGDELLRGRAAARFEGATLAGLGVGLVAAGPLFVGIGGWGGLGATPSCSTP